MPSTSLAPEPLSWRRPLVLFLLLVGVAAYSYHLGGYALFDPDEGRNAEVGREMVARGDWLVPRLDGLPYLDKPVLFFASEAAAFAAFGASEWTARLTALLFTFATGLLVGRFARKLYGVDAGWMAGVASVAAPLALTYSRTVIFDAQLTFFLTVALIAFYRAIEGRREGRSSVGWTALAWFGIAMGVLAKGPVALGVPLLAAAPYAIWRRRSFAVWHPVGIVVLAAVVTPWLIAMQKAVPDFLHYALVSETWERLTTDSFERTGPFWYFVPILVFGAVPWSGLVAAGWRSVWPRQWEREGDGRSLYLALWLVLPFLLFSFSHSKRPHYVLPLLPAIALLAAGIWSGGRREGRLPGVRTAAGSWLLFGLIAASGAVVVVTRPDRVPGGLPHLEPTLIGLALVMMACGIAAWLKGRSRWPAFVALVLPVCAIPVIGAPLLDEVGHLRSARELAAAIAPQLAHGGEVVGLHAFPPSLPFYLGRSMPVVSGRGRELTSNYVARNFEVFRDRPDSLLRSEAWWRAALSRCERPLVAVVNQDDEAGLIGLRAAGLPLLYQGQRFAAYGPCRPAAAVPPPAVSGTP